MVCWFFTRSFLAGKHVCEANECFPQQKTPSNKRKTTTSKKTRGNSNGKHLSRDFPTFPVVFLEKYSELSGKVISNFTPPPPQQSWFRVFFCENFFLIILTSQWCVAWLVRMSQPGWQFRCPTSNAHPREARPTLPSRWGGEGEGRISLLLLYLGLSFHKIKKKHEARPAPNDPGRRGVGSYYHGCFLLLFSIFFAVFRSRSYYQKCLC